MVLLASPMARRSLFSPPLRIPALRQFGLFPLLEQAGVAGARGGKLRAAPLCDVPPA